MCMCFKSDGSFSGQCGGTDIPIYVFKIQFSTLIDHNTVIVFILPFQGALERVTGSFLTF